MDPLPNDEGQDKGQLSLNQSPPKVLPKVKCCIIFDKMSYHLRLSDFVLLFQAVSKCLALQLKCCPLSTAADVIICQFQFLNILYEFMLQLLMYREWWIKKMLGKNGPLPFFGCLPHLSRSLSFCHKSGLWRSQLSTGRSIWSTFSLFVCSDVTLLCMLQLHLEVIILVIIFKISSRRCKLEYLLIWHALVHQEFKISWPSSGHSN